MVSIKLVTATWCSPCKAYKPVLHQFCNENGISLQEVDVDYSKDTVQSYGISSVPTTMIFKDGQLVQKMTGAVSKSQLQSLVQSYK